MKITHLILCICTFVFLQACEESSRGELNYTLMAITAQPAAGDLRKVKKLVENGAEVNIEVDDFGVGQTPILNVAWGMDKEKMGRTMSDSLWDISEREAVKIARYLISNGADIHKRVGSNNRNALHMAALGGRAHMIRTLVESGLDIDSRDGMNITALMLAAESGCLEAVEACVELGADINALMSSGGTALDRAIQYHTKRAYETGMVMCKEHGEIIKYLEENGATRSGTMH